MKEILVVSAINFFEGGPLTILKECLEYLSHNLSDKFTIIALVHDKKLLNVEHIEFVEFKQSRKSWLYRMYYEYVFFFFLSRRIKPYLWLSLHDISPCVTAKIRAVYCHNPSPFLPFTFYNLFYSYQVALFSLFYKYLYRINIRKNSFVIVQQDWIRTAFQEMYGIKNVVVSYPNVPTVLLPDTPTNSCHKTIFFYPAFPRVFKNFKVIADAAKLLYEQGRIDFEVLLTISGEENKFAHHIVSKYKDIPTLHFIGLKSREEISVLYQNISALIFPSKLETWGLPITEAKQFHIPMILADLPYARETVGDYDKVTFFNPDDHTQLAEYMKLFIDGDLVYDGNQSMVVREPFANNWDGLFEILLSSGGTSNA